MKKVIFYCVLFSFAQSFAQGIQMNQTPLLYHPSFAGSTGGGRLAFSTQGFHQKNEFKFLKGDVYYIMSDTKKTLLTNYLSFDHLWKGIGWGMVVKNQDYFYRSDHHSQLNNFNRILNGADVIISPKFVLKNRRGEARLTLAPSLSLGYSYENSSRPYYYPSYMKDNFLLVPSYMKEENRLSYGKYGYGYDQEKAIHSLYQATFGLMLNSSMAYLGISYQYSKAEIQAVEYRYHAIEDSTGFINTYRYGEVLERRLTTSYSALSLVSGKTLKRTENSKFSFSYQFYIGFGFPNKKNEVLGSTSFLQNLSANLTATYNKVYVGAGGAAKPTSNVALFAGYQSKRMRIGASYGWKLDGSVTPRATIGLSASFFFPK